MFKHLAIGTAACGLRRPRLVHARLDLVFTLAIATAMTQVQTGVQTHLSCAGFRRPSSNRRVNPPIARRRSRRSEKSLSNQD